MAGRGLGVGGGRSWGHGAACLASACLGTRAEAPDPPLREDHSPSCGHTTDTIHPMGGRLS